MKFLKVFASWNNNWPICWASERGNVKLVKFLMGCPNVDPTARYNYSIQKASAIGHQDVVQELLKDKRVPRVTFYKFKVNPSK